MNDRAKLLAALEDGRLLHPSADVANAVDLANAIAYLAGADGTDKTENATAIANLIASSEHMVFVLADGFGMNLVESMGKEAFLSSHVAMELRTVFPSTTPTVLTTLATGKWPGQHATLGWFTYIPDISAVATIIHFVRRSDDRPLSALGLTAELVYPVPSGIPHLGRDTLSLLPEQVADSPYSAYWSGGTPRRAYGSLREAVDAIVARVTAARAPTFTYLYSPSVDAACHEYGIGHRWVHAAVQELDREMERLSAGLAGRGRIVLTADHGLLDAASSEIHVIGPTDPLVQCLSREPAGDGRAMCFDVLEGEEARFYQLLKERLEDRFLVISIDAAADMGLFGHGQLSPESRSRLGNTIAISAGSDVLEYHWPGEKGRGPKLISHHSGLTPAEMRVPLVLA